MSDPTILYAGIFCLVFVLLGVALTVYEFHKLTSRGTASAVNQALATEREAGQSPGRSLPRS